MAKKSQPISVNQNMIGNDNIQVVGDHNVITKITNYITGDTEQQRATRNRHDVLRWVKNTWVKGVLEKSLYNEVLIELGLEERLGSVHSPWDMQVQMPNQPNRILPHGTSIMQVFDEMDGAMLVLGEPGAGKTTMLLELARDKIANAEQDISLPIPIVFNLTTWYQRKNTNLFNLIRKIFRQPLLEFGFYDWLVEELKLRYNIPKDTAQFWLKRDELLLLLDGLDEIKSSTDRVACVKAINRFRNEHGFTKLVISSRISDYEELTPMLNLQGAVYLQLLTSKQIDEYLERAGERLAALRYALLSDTTLKGLAQQPLMLNVMTLAYRDISNEELVNERFGDIEQRRKHLFDTYISQMFKRISRTINQSYTREQTTHWLAWLAEKLKGRGSAPFLPQAIEQSWLRTRIQELLHKFIISTIRFLFWAFFSGFFVELLGRLKNGRGFGFDNWLTTEVFVGLNAVLVFGILSPEMKTRIFPDQNIRLATILSISFGLFYGLFFWQVDRMIARSGLIDGLILMPLLVPFFMLYYGGDQIINYYALRFLLYHNDYMPWDYARFLDFAVDRIFMYKVGGGYIFIHRLLMEHFADMYPENEEQI